MNDVQKEIEALRQEVAELRAGLQALQPPSDSHSGGWGEDVVRLIKENLTKKGKTRGIGVVRAVILLESDGSNWVVSGIVTKSDVGDVPSEQALSEKAALFGNLLALRTFRKMEERFFEGKPMQMTKAELAIDLNTSEAELEKALNPLLAHEWLRCIKTATGEEIYEYAPNDGALLLLTLP